MFLYIIQWYVVIQELFLCQLLSIHHQANLVTWYGPVHPEFAARKDVRAYGW